MKNTNHSNAVTAWIVKCKQCHSTLRSTGRHDFKQCKCPNETFVDGGKHYWRVGGIDPTKIEIVKETDDR